MGPAAAFVGASGAWSGFGTTRRARSPAKAPLVWRARRARRAWLRCPWAGRRLRRSPAQQGEPSKPATKSAPPQGSAALGTAAAPLIDARIQAERPASRVAR